MATIIGTDEPDTLTGTSAADHISGGDGGDRIEGLAGDDLIEGGPGNDDIRGGDGSDDMYGGEGNDRFFDSSSSSATVAENDRMFGEGGNDDLRMELTVAPASTRLLDGGAGDDRIVFEAWYFVHDVTVAGGDGADYIHVNGAKTINIDAGAGADQVSFRFGRIDALTITLGEGSDLVRIPAIRFSDDLPAAPARITDFDAAAGGDRLVFDAFLYVLSNTDRISNPFATGHIALEQRGGVGAVLKVDFNGGGDDYNDFVVLEGVDAAALGIANIGFDPSGAAGPGLTLTGSAAADQLIGSGHGDTISGGDGNDVIDGHSGSDAIDGGLGNDQIEGGWGHDELSGGDGDDEIADHHGGDDELYGGEGNDKLAAERGSRTPFSTVLLDGGAGNDDLRVAPLNDVPYRRLVDDVTLRGGTGDDAIYVNAARNATIEAGDGADRVSIAHEGTQFTISLGAGADLLSFSNSRVVAGAVTVTDFETGETGDRLEIDTYLRDQLPAWDPTSHPYEQQFLRLSQRGADAVLEIDRDGPAGPGAFADLIVFQNSIAASFTARNLGGYSIVDGTGGADRLEGTQYIDLIRGFGGDDELIGLESGDTLLGGDGDDTLDGASGKDRLDGGPGADTMTGGAQDDVYVVDDAGDTVSETDGQWSTHGHGDEVRTSLAAYTLPAFVERLIGTSAAGQALTANEGANTVLAGAGNDVILLLGGVNRAEGGAGDDRIEGGADNDQIFGGPGSDIVLGHGGDDFLAAAIGLDAAAAVNRVDGGDGNDSLWGGRGHDTLIGGAGNDWLRFSEGGDDVFEAGDGDDVIEMSPLFGGAPQVLQLSGGDGNDRVHSGGAPGLTLTADLGAGNDSINFNHLEGTMTVTLGGGSDTLSISAYADVGLRGALTVTDFATGAGGDRMLLQAFVVAWLVGRDPSQSPFQTGHLRLVQSGADTLLQIDRNGGGDDFVTRVVFEATRAAAFTADNLDGFAPPAVFGTQSGDTVRGTAAGETIDALGGNDLIDLGQSGDDRAFGGAGNDVLYFGGAFTAGDVADGGEGTDTLVLQGDYPALVLGPGSLAGIEGVSLQSGSIARWGQSGTASFDYGLETADGNVAPGQRLRVNAQSLQPGEDLAFDGSDETDGGSFLVYGGFGADVLTGGAGNDIFFFEAGRFGAGDRIDGGGGNDAVVVSGAAAGATGPVEIAIAAGTLTSIESLSFNGRFASDPAAQPSYALVLANGNLASGDRLIVNGSALGPAQTLSVDGSAVADGWLAMFGGAGADALTGGGNGDLFYAAAGADQLTGGGGADIFQYRAASDSAAAAADRILDFEGGSDRIDLSGIDADGAADGDQAFAWIGAGAFSGNAGQLRGVQNGDTGIWTVEGDIDGDSAADFQILVTMPGGAQLAAGDFVL